MHIVLHDQEVVVAGHARDVVSPGRSRVENRTVMACCPPAVTMVCSGRGLSPVREIHAAVVVYLDLFPAAVGYVTWARVLSAWPASQATTALFLIPGLSLVIAWSWLGEVPTLFALVGGTLSLTGVGLVRKAGLRRARVGPEAATGERLWVPARAGAFGRWLWGRTQGSRETTMLSTGDGPMREETLDPQDWEAFRALAHRMVDRMLDAQRDVRERPVWRPVPEEVEARFQETRPLGGQGVEAAYEDFLELVLPYPTGNDHPRFWGWAGGTGSPTGMMAELLAAGMNPVSGLFNDGAFRVERQVVDWMKDALGLPADASGVFTSGGSVANLIGLAVGRDARAGYDVTGRGVGAEDGKLVFYVSSETHSSMFKAAKLLGLGQNAARVVPVDDCLRMDIGELRGAIERDRRHGLRPFAVVGTAGTINTGSVDDLNAIADVAQDEGLWFHVDGAFGAMAALSPETRDLVAGLERMDSLAFDFHKWMYAPYEAGCVMIRDADAHRATFSFHADYLTALPRGTGAQPESTDLRSPQLSRGFKALKVWMTLKEHGFEKFGRLVAQNVAQARYLGDLVERDRALELMAPVALNVVAFRFAPPDVDETVLNEVNRELLMRLQERGVAVPSSTYLGDRFVIRVCICNHRSRREDFDLLVREAVRIGEEIVAEAGLLQGA